MKKKKTTPKSKAWDAFSKWIRLRDALITTGTKDNAKCVTCDKVYPVKQMHAGHFVHGRHDFDERNIHAQCVHCNHFLSGNEQSYTLFMIDTYGRKVVDELRENHDLDLRKKADYEELERYYKEEFKETYANN